ncbi:hypothetical protein [Micrococcoides hystricis]|uniref:SMODS-associating 2TM beta-strand rich effector domain-containing protein n=1 Tax=Micrococcoides hystricis TaxID=1572761 RepID=A0ABV6P7M8_9MICC
MTSRFASVLFDAAKVAFAAWNVLWIEPWVDQFQSIGMPWSVLIAALIAAIALEIVVQLLFGWPTILIEWSVKDEGAPLNELQARVRLSNPESQVFLLKISAARRGWLGHKVLRLVVDEQTELKISIERASIVPICELSSKVNDLIAIKSNDEFNGFKVLLGKPPSRPALWHWAEVRWKDEQTPKGEEFNVEYSFYNKNRLRNWLLKLIWRSANARHFRIVGQ